MKISIIVMTLLMSLTALASTKINGAGASFPFPIYSKWISEYNKVNKEILINYQSIGSGGGVRQITKETVDFGASDVPMKEKELKEAPYKIMHIPTVLGAVVITYNLKSVKEKLKLDAQVVSDIYMGKIKKWNDVRIQKLNPKVKLPEKSILAAYRADRSGTTAIFTRFLAENQKEWSDKIGQGKAVKWPVGLGGKGNEGVTALVKQTDGAIGYIELAYALTNKLAFASMKNNSGAYIDPSLETVSAAASVIKGTTDKDILTSVVNSSAPKAYPLASMTYILLPLKKEKDAKYKELLKFINWALSDGQKYAKDLHYGALPKGLAEAIRKKLQKL